MAMTEQNPLTIDLGDLDLREIEIYLQEGSRGVPELSASCHNTNLKENACGCSCQGCCSSCQQQTDFDEL
jgi:hypothetical protein